MVTLRPDELDLMTPAERREHLAREERTVFGENFRRDRRGKPVEQGFGSPGNETEQHFLAIRKYEGPEAEAAARAEAAKRHP